MEFRPWLLLSEASQQETQALNILGGDEKTLARLKSISPEPKFLPVLALLSREQTDLEQLKRDWEAYKGFMNDKRMPVLAVQGDNVVYAPKNEPVDYLRWSERVHALQGESELVQSRMRADHFGERPPIFRNESLEVYETDGPGDCIKYGKGYSFCISQPGNTMWQSYRDSQTSTFYFVYDKSRPDTDPLHIVVVDITKNGPKLTDARNTTGRISEYETDANAYLEYLYKKGMPRGLLKNKPHTEHEQMERELLGQTNYSLNWFKGLPPDQKSKYIGRGHMLTDEQFDYIFDNGLESLIKQYAEIGRKLDDYQMEKMLNSKFRSTYLHFRLIANQNNKDLDVREYDRLNEKQKESLSDNIKFMMLLKKGFRDDAIKLLPNISPAVAVSAAAEVGDIDLLNHFDKSGDINKSHLLGPMLAAVKGESADSVTWLIKKGAPPKHALPMAAKKGNLDWLKWIIEKAEEHSLTTSDKDGWEDDLNRAAEAAAKMGDYEIFSYLTDPDNHLVDLNSDFSWQKAGQRMIGSALRSSSAKDKEGQIKIVKNLIDRGFKVSFSELYMLMDHKPKHIIDFLLDMEAKDERNNHFSHTMLESLARSGNIGELKSLINTIEEKGMSAIRRSYSMMVGAAKGGFTAILDFVLDDLIESRELTEFELDSIMRSAIYGSKTKVMDWVRKKGLVLKGEKEFIDIAVNMNSLNSVKWLIANMGEEGVDELREAIAKHGDRDPNFPDKKIDRSAIRRYADSLGS